MSACALVTSVLALVASVGAAQAVAVSGSLWENVTLPWSSTCQCAVPSNVPTTTPDVTFTTTWKPGVGNPLISINFSSGPDLPGMPGPGFSIGTFLTSLATTTINTGAGELTHTIANTFLELTGTVPLSNGNIVAGSDDGSTLIINGTQVYSSPSAQGFGLLNHPWTGGDGTFSFELVYGKSGFGPPAQLVIELPETPVATPLPAALPLFATGLGTIGLFGWRRKRKAQAVA